MMSTGVLCLFLLSVGSASDLAATLDSLEKQLDDYTFEEDVCNKSTWDIVTHLELVKNRDRFAMTRPARNYRTPTKVYLDFLLYAILEVQEKEQKFIAYVWLDQIWKHYQIHWDPNQFCNITSMAIPAKLLWQPDITIEERTERNRDNESPFVHVNYNGWVLSRNNMVLVTTCKMKIYRFPFDTQSCSLSFKSVIYDVNQTQVFGYSNQNSTTEWSKEVMHTQSDWIFINITSKEATENNFEITQSMVIYTINMKRRYLLYVVNFILPILMFLGLDLASFLISDSSGEKLSFKVTVLLAVTVMQLILNEILPSSSDRIPLIAIYCVGIFGLMMLSLLETIFVMYLIEKDSANKSQSLSEGCVEERDKVCCLRCFKDVHELQCDMSAGGMSSELLPMAKQASSSQLLEGSYDGEKAALSFLSGKMRGEQTGYWTRVTQKIDRVFFIFYVIIISGFLTYMFFRWTETN